MIETVANLIGELFVELFLGLVGAFLFATGEVLRGAVTLGRHRVRWRELDFEEALPSRLLGLAFWGAGVVLVLRLIRA